MIGYVDFELDKVSYIYILLEMCLDLYDGLPFLLFQELGLNVKVFLMLNIEISLGNSNLTFPL